MSNLLDRLVSTGLVWSFGYNCISGGDAIDVWGDVYPFICLSVYSKILCLCLSIYPSARLSVCPSICLSFCPCVRLSIYSSIHLFIYLSVRLSVYPSVHVSVYLSVHLSICLSICLFKICHWPKVLNKERKEKEATIELL